MSARRFFDDYKELGENFGRLVRDYQALSDLFLELAHYNKNLIDELRVSNPDISLRMANKLQDIINRHTLSE